MQNPHSRGYIQDNGHKYKDRHPLANALLNLVRDALGALVLLFAILMPFFAFWLLVPQG